MSKIKTLDEWIKLYEKKTRLPYENTDKRMVRYFFPERGFAEIGISKDMVIVQKFLQWNAALLISVAFLSVNPNLI